MGIAAKRIAEPAAAARVPPSVDVREIRAALGLSQSKFGARFGFSLATIRSWEQGRTRPDAAGRAFLLTIKAAPDVVANAIAAAQPANGEPERESA